MPCLNTLLERSNGSTVIIYHGVEMTAAKKIAEGIESAIRYAAGDYVGSITHVSEEEVLKNPDKYISVAEQALVYVKRADGSRIIMMPHSMYIEMQTRSRSSTE
jgi:hypothetical protein